MFVCPSLSLSLCLMPAAFYQPYSLSCKTCKLDHNYADVLESSMEGHLPILPGSPFLRYLCLRVWLLPQTRDPFLSGQLVSK